MDDRIRNLIFRLVDRTISSDDFERLQDALERDEEVREKYLQVVGLCESLGEIALESTTDTRLALNAPALKSADEKPLSLNFRRFTGPQLVIAAALLIVVGAGAFWLGRWNQQDRAEITTTSGQRSAERSDARIAGHATLRRAVDLEWPQDAERRLEGDVLPNGPFRFEGGLAEIDFFCGATLIVEGPAQLEIASDWSVRVTQGRLRVNVPPAARGFVVQAADSEIIDLGTEFALEVSSEDARVEVIEGEVELRNGQHDGKHLVTGESASLLGTQSDTSVTEGLSTTLELSQQRHEANARLFAEWQTHSQRLRADERLIAYFAIAEGLTTRAVPNRAQTGSRFDGLIVGPVEYAAGRFDQAFTGLRFDRLGSRVRTRIDGEFQALSFACWVKIDRLGHRYNALFMGDGFENGEPHWQIRDDGRLMISIMVDDSQEIQHFSELERQVVTKAGLHRNYYSEPFWRPSMSGQWFHLAAVYDPVSQRVRQFANGQVICDVPISDEFLVTRLRIGPAEIGNWGQPFRKTPEFAVRNLNGTIDELTIFDAPLSLEEIQFMYERGKPLGY